MENFNKKIALIGIPGSGKSTIAKRLSKKLGIKYIDTDKVIEKNYGKIEDLFKIGEEHFRDLETKVLLKALNFNGKCIISTGGGIVERDENIEALKESSLVIFIDRPLKLIANNINYSTRPLLKDKKIKSLENLYARRYEKYKSASDLHFINDGGVYEIVCEIMEKLQL